MTDPARFTMVALLVQTALGVAGWFGAAAGPWPVRFGARPLASVAVGVGVGAALAALMRWLLARQPAWMEALRRTVDDQLVQGRAGDRLQLGAAHGRPPGASSGQWPCSSK